MFRALLPCALALPLALSAQVRVASTIPVQPVVEKKSIALSSATAVRASTAPVLDGKAEDAVWDAAPAITAFRQFEPNEDGEPSYQTTAKVSFDERNLYVLLRAEDPTPQLIVGQLTRRDQHSPSDWLMVLVDSYHDRRTGFEFHVNAAGVKRDAAIINDGEEDNSWDGVWDVAIAKDAAGWSAEFRIPLSQLRFPPNGSPTFGMLFVRNIGRSGERISWPVYRRNKGGLVSQFAEVSGFEGLSSPRRLEITPYTVAKSVSQSQVNGSGRVTGYDRAQLSTVGADVKYGVTSNLTLDATINPDFGQVEADPAQLNLSAFETFYAERRPFFMEGAGLFRFDINCNDGSCSGLFYSRRIGRSPQLNGDAMDEDPTVSTSSSTPILGAAKLTGRTPGGLQIGILDAVTGERTARGRDIGEVVTEPRTNYLVGRLAQDFRKGNSTIGVMATSVNRSLDDYTESRLRRSALTAGIDTRHRFAKERFEVTGWIAASQVRGSKDAIALTQSGSGHYYQRPDADLEYDPERESLPGSAGQVAFAKIGGGNVRFQSSFRVLSPGFEINDIGYLARADEQSQSNWVGLTYNKPTKLYRMARVNFNQWQSWNTEGLRTRIGGNVNAHVQLPSMWWLHAGVNGSDFLPSFDDRMARGGPAVRNSPGASAWFGFEGDSRKRVTPYMFVGTMRSEEGRTHGYFVDPMIEYRASNQLRLSAGPTYQHDVMDNYWFGRFDLTTASATTETHYAFARLDQQTLSVTTRMDFTATPNLTLQLYARPYLTVGKYADVRELADPRAESYGDRYRPFTPVDAADPAKYAGFGASWKDFNYKALNTNAVLRWEYRPGSSVFVVWQHGRQQWDRNAGDFQARRDYRDLLRAHPDNTFLVKASYWLSL